MKKIIPFMLLLCILLFLLTGIALADDNATNISFYQQSRGATYVGNDVATGPFTEGYWDVKVSEQYDGLKIAKNPKGSWKYISNRGCCLLTYAHAIQRLTGEKATEERQIAILAELLKVNNDPPNAESEYAAYIVKQYGASHGVKEVEVNKTWQAVTGHFDNGGIIVFNPRDPDGHICLAVDYLEKDVDGNGKEEKWILLVDSQVRATIKRLNSGVCYNGGFTKKYTKNDLPASSGYGRLWISFSDFTGENWHSCFTSTTAGKPSTPTPTFASLFNIHAGFKTTEKMITRAEPFDGAATVKTIEKGTMFVVFKFVTNSEGDIWAQLDEATDNYVCFYDASKDKVMLDFVHVAQNTTVSGFPASSSDDGYPGYPTGDREPGGCPLRGTITSVAPMLSIEARVTNLSTNKEVLSVTAKPKYDLRSAKINSDITNRDGSKTNINNKMSFSKVADDGHYVYEIAVQHGFVYEGKTFSFGDENVVFDSTFTIGDPEETLPDVPEPTKKPTGTQIGTTTVLKGDVNDDKVVDMLDVILLMEWYCGYDVSINLLNADVTGDDTPDMLDIITIMEWYCGYDVDFV